MSMLANAISMIQQALPGLSAGSPVHTAALRAAQQLSRHMAQGQPTAGVQQTQFMDLIRNLGRNAILSKIMQGQGGQPGGDQGGPAGPSPAPMPSTPLPGA